MTLSRWSRWRAIGAVHVFQQAVVLSTELGLFGRGRPASPLRRADCGNRARIARSGAEPPMLGGTDWPPGHRSLPGPRTGRADDNINNSSTPRRSGRRRRAAGELVPRARDGEVARQDGRGRFHRSVLLRIARGMRWRTIQFGAAFQFCSACGCLFQLGSKRQATGGKPSYTDANSLSPRSF